MLPVPARRRAPAAAGALAAAALLLPVAAAAHEAMHEVVRGRAVAVRAFYADGDPMADAAFEVYAPADAGAPHQEGFTDRNGWLAFVPDAPGAWRVRVMDGTGHGLDVEVPVGPAAPAGAGGSAPASVAFVLRPLLGLAALGAVFAGLFLLWRRRGPAA